LVAPVNTVFPQVAPPTSEARATLIG